MSQSRRASRKRRLRFTLDAYEFVRDALAFGQDALGMGSPRGRHDDADPEDEESPAPRVERHISGQQLCEAARIYALEQYGYMAKTVLNSWGIRSTGDIGEVVYEMIELGMMRKSDKDRREDFEDVYDFDEAFQRQFQIALPE
jgi:uncharacterized repeat protein (TIGR04138 family)